MTIPIFRGKSLSNNEFIEGQVHTYGDGFFIAQTRLLQNDGLDWRVPAIEIDPATINQFTGFCDKNSRKIFEGDWLKHWVDTASEWQVQQVVRFDDGSFLLTSDSSRSIFEVPVSAVFQNSEVVISIS